MPETLFRDGYRVAVNCGRLLVLQSNGESIDGLWLKKNRQKLVTELARLTGKSIFQYSHFSTGRYSIGERLLPGVTLSYFEGLTDRPYRMCFNAELTYARATAKAKKGQNLPPKHFRVKQRSALVSYWEKLGFSLPRRFSEFHEHLGKLGEVLITAEWIMAYR